jgi:hypothetical protein
MRETIADHGRRGAGALALGLALLVGVGAGGCGPSGSQAATPTQPGGRRQQMSDFMKTQKKAGPATTKARRHP